MDEPVCFNCEGAGTDLHYPNIENIVACDAGEWLDYEGLDFFVVPCVYCTEELEPPRKLPRRF